MGRVIEVDVVSFEEGVNLHPGPVTQHAAHLSFRQALAAVSLQRQGFKSGAREVWLLVLDHACDIVRDLELHVHTAQLSHPLICQHWRTSRDSGSWAEASGRYARVRLVFRPILLDQRPQSIARNTNGARRGPQRYIVVRRTESPWVLEELLHRFAWHGRSVR
jgi:hypothetical protein